MAKKFYKNQLKKLSLKALSKIAISWRIKTCSSASDLIEKIYNHQNNQMARNISKTKKCYASTERICCIDECKSHPQAKYTSRGIIYKCKPTKFHRAPLPICWFIAPIQFLSVIQWDASCFTFTKAKPQHLFSKFFKMIEIARFDTSGNTFKAAPWQRNSSKILDQTGASTNNMMQLNL